MRRKSTKIAAALLSAVLVLQSGLGGGNAVSDPVLQVSAEEQATENEVSAVSETQPEAQPAAEEQTQAPTEPPTEAPTEPPTEAPTEPPTEAPTEPPTEAQTQAPTEVQTQVTTEAQTQAPTEAQTQAPTEAQTQAPTEAQTQAATEAQTAAETATEKVTEAATEKETEAATEKETERSDRKNDGEKMKASDLVKALDEALPYLIVAEDLTLPEQKEEENAFHDCLILQGTEAETVLKGLEDFSVELANAKSSSDAEVINLYADEDGYLDEAQLEEQFEDLVIDVTKKYFVVNVIACEADQELKFAGYDMVLSQLPVEYKEETQPGDILYNFAAMDEDEFVGYEGTVTLTDNLQGTFLAPEAEVKVEDDLAGAVFANTVSVDEAVEELLHIVFVDGKQEEETAVTEEITEAKETEAEGAVDTEASAEPETVIEITEEPETITEAAEVSEPETESNTEIAAEETEVSTEIVINETEVNTEEETVEIFLDETEAAESETAAVVTEDLSTDDTFEVIVEEELDTAVWYSADGIILKVLLDDVNTEGNLAAAMTVMVRAAEDITNADGTVVFAKDAVVKSQEYTTETAADLGKEIQHSGMYYLDVTEVGTDGAKYLDPARVYFEIDQDGNAVFAPAAESETTVHAGGASWNDSEDELTIQLLSSEGDVTAKKALAISVVEDSTEENPKQISSAAFVVKDEDGGVLMDSASKPLYYLDYAGSKAVLMLDDLTNGTYYLSQIQTADGYLIDTADKRFKVVGDEIYFVTTSLDGDKITEAKARQEITITNKALAQVQNAGTLTVTAKTSYDGVLLTAEQENTRYIALFADTDLTKRVSEVQIMKQEAGKTESDPVTFAGLAQDITAETVYYPAQTDEFGTAIRNDLLSYLIAGTAFVPVTEGVQEQKTACMEFNYKDGAEFPSTDFSYPVEVIVTKNVLDQSGSGEASDSTFYFNIYRTTAGSSELGEKMFKSPVAIAMNGASSAAVSCQIKMTAVTETFAIREVDQNGTVLTTETKDFQYAVSYPENPDGTFTVNCNQAADEEKAAAGQAEPVKLTIQNKDTNSLVKIQVEDASTGKLISGVSLVIKNKSGKVVLINEEKVLTSGKEAIQLQNILDSGQTYYLSALKTPSGYAVASDVAFTVNKSGETIVSLKYSAAKTTDYKLTVSKQVYVGQYPVYARDNTTGQYAAQGAYTFYVALFADAARIQKVSDVQTVTVSGLSGTTTFKNLEKGQTYYVGETDEWGQLKKSTSELSVKYASKGVVTMSDKSKTTIIQNAYSNLPDGYNYTGTLTITKKVTNTSGNATKVTESFYAGIYKTSDYSDKPTVVKLDLKDVSSASVKRRIVFTGTKDKTTYYIAEVDENGNRITDDSDFAYTVKIDSPTAVISKGANTTVTITNQVKSTKATLYITKKVYSGTTQQAVNETFYAGLFKDPEFKNAYTKPIALKLDNKSELTLKLSLNLGTASSTKIYIAEVDADGNVIKDEKTFGYQIKLVNSTAEFTQDRREIQAILLNSKYGTTTTNDWNTVLSSDGNDVSSMDTGYWGVSGNGDISESTAAQTGDETPVLTYVSLMCAALFVLAGGFLSRRRATK